MTLVRLNRCKENFTYLSSCSEVYILEAVARVSLVIEVFDL